MSVMPLTVYPVSTSFAGLEWDDTSVPTFEKAFHRARVDSARHMRWCEEAGIRWGETTITEIVMSRAGSAVNVVPFTQPAEANSGADWVWWWVDSTAAYGMLVQAKRVTIDSRRNWKFDFDYRGGKQHSTLTTTSARLDLTPVYALYLGTADYRRRLPCSGLHRSGYCTQCAKRSISLMPARLAEPEFVTDASSTYDRSVALEDLWRKPPGSAPLIPELERQMDVQLVDFLTQEQQGPRAVTRAMIDLILKARAGHLTEVTTRVDPSTADGRHDELDPIFRNLPQDVGHWSTPYIPHALQGLFAVPPEYVLEILHGEYDVERTGASMPDNIAGVVVVSMPQNA